MRTSKSNVLSVALAVGVSAVAFSASADAQNSSTDFPWRSNTRAKSKVVVPSTKSIAKQVETSFAAPARDLATPARDLATVETIATPTPSNSSLPSVIYDEGKKYVRQGDVYVESPDSTTPAVAQHHYTQPLPAVEKKTSLFAKTKGLAGRLNPFSKSRSSSAYQSKDWQVPSFSKSLPTFAKKDDDPITFAAVNALPAKNSTPSSINESKSFYADNKADNLPAVTLPARDSKFTAAIPTETKVTSALPTETKLTSVFSTEEKDVSAFAPEKKVTSEFTLEKKVASTFSPKKKVVTAFPAEKKVTSAFPTETKLTSAISKSKENSEPGFIAVGGAEPAVSEPAISKPVTSSSFDPKPIASKTFEPKPMVPKTFEPTPMISKPIAAKPIAAKPIAAKSVASEPVATKPIASEPVVSHTTRVPAASSSKHVNRILPVLDKKPAPIPRSASLVADDQFWSPRRR